MKLHLHWLRFDLHRFRLILGIWTLLVAVYAVFLGWVHLRFLTISRDILDRSLYIAILLGLVELCFLFALFNADPAKGPRHFWKTRPPSGTAVAASKLMLALTFFVALPLLAWWAVNAICVHPELASVQSSTGLSWTAFLFWIQSLMVGAFALAAARPESKRDFYLHLAASAAAVAAGVWAIREVWDTLASRSMDQRMEYWLRNGFFTPLMAVLTLMAATVYLLLVRRRRLPRGKGLHWLMLLPAGSLLTASAAWQAPAVPLRDEFLPPVTFETAKEIRITQQFPAFGGFNSMGPSAGYATLNPLHLYWPSPERMWFEAHLKVDGLPPGTRVSARWLDLRLTAPDGTVIQADTRLFPLQPSGITQHDPGALLTYRVPFNTGKLHPYDLTRCTAAGTLRLTLYSWQSGILPSPDGRIHASPMGPVLIYPKQENRISRPLRETSLELFNIDYFQPEYPTPFRIRMVRDSDEVPLVAHGDSAESAGGFLVGYARNESSAWTGNLRNPWSARQTELLDTFWSGRPAPSGWQLKIEASNPVSILDVPVILQDVIPWTEQSMEPSFLRILAGIHPGEKSSADEIRGDLRYAYSLLHNAFWIFGGSRSYEEVILERNWEALLESVPLWRDILAEVPHEHLPVLIEVIKDDTWTKEISQEEYNKAVKNPPSPASLLQNPPSILQIRYHLRKRIAELLQPADLPGILAEPDLAAKLRPLLPASAAVPESAVPQAPKADSNAQKPDR